MNCVFDECVVLFCDEDFFLNVFFFERGFFFSEGVFFFDEGVVSF